MNTYKVLNKNSFSKNEYSIVPIRYEDRYDIMQWRNEQMYHLRQAKLLTEIDQDKYFDDIISKLYTQERPSQVLFSYLKGDECIGYGGLVHINWVDSNAEVSFIMDTKLEKEHFEFHWENYLKLIEQIAFKYLGLHKIFTYAFDLRPKLYSALKNSGFKHEANLKEHCFFNGKYVDILYHAKINKLNLRLATNKDTEKTYQWAIDPKIRKYSFNKKNIQKDEHVAWFNEKLHDAHCFYYILEDSLKNSLGSIRVDVKNEIGTISYLLDSHFFGRGLGTTIVRLLEEAIKIEKMPIKQLVGFVLEENIASIKIFKKLNYTQHNNQGKIKFEKKMN